VVWGEVSEAILNKDWDKARQAKRRAEDMARKLANERNDTGEV
jgi:oxysterol-binding protein-related protein 8